MTDLTSTWSNPALQFDWNLSAHITPPGVDPTVARWAHYSAMYGNEAGIDPRLVMAIVFNEGADANLTWGGAQGELKDSIRKSTSTFRKMYDGKSNSLGLTNMKEDTFNEVKKAFPERFADKNWSDLAKDQELAVKAAAYDLKMVKGKWEAQIPAGMKARYSLNQILAAGYNAEIYFGGSDGYIAKGDLGTKALAYAEMTMADFMRADKVMRRIFVWDGMFDDAGMAGMGYIPGTGGPLPPPPSFEHNRPQVYDPRTWMPYPSVPGAATSGVGTIAAVTPLVPASPSDLVSGVGAQLISEISGAATMFAKPMIDAALLPKGALLRRADGGDVKGPGSSIGDRIPAFLSNGEFIVNAASANANRPLLKAINDDPNYMTKYLQQIERSVAAALTRVRANSNSVGEHVDRSMTVHISAHDVHEAFAKAKLWGQRHALTGA
ncbi:MULTISPECIES: hypothetical protein [unclassified Nocardia]|uniref:hypothetical protein n=1 Tax=unclassified Nocardia TaxID=2637762 RepID=UPI001CE43044|nr:MULTISPECIES: hypothetical protein [unclassified Nocardia]